MNQSNLRSTNAFTLIELLVVISIIAVLMGLLLPAATSAMDSAKKAQAKNDAIGICNAVRNYSTEYGKFPGTSGSDVTLTSSNNVLIRVLAGAETGTPLQNPRKIVFLEPPAPKKIGTSTFVSGASSETGWNFHDPWGSEYQIRYDGNYDNDVENWYSTNAGPGLLRTQAIARSIGKDKTAGSSDKKAGAAADDIISWQ